MIHLLDLLANHADKLRARIEMDAVFLSFWMFLCSMVAVWNDWVTRFFVCVKNP